MKPQNTTILGTDPFLCKMCSSIKAICLISSFCLTIILAGCEQRQVAGTYEKVQNERTNDSAENELNEKRATLGLRIIDSHWVLYRSLPTQDDWKIRTNGFLAKSVFKSATGKVLSEEDYYYSGAQFIDRNGHGWEFITVHYDYGTNNVMLSYSGTNRTTEAMLYKYLMVNNGFSTNIAAVMAAVKVAAGGWPDGPK